MDDRGEPIMQAGRVEAGQMFNQAGRAGQDEPIYRRGGARRSRGGAPYGEAGPGGAKRGKAARHGAAQRGAARSRGASS